MEPEEKVCDPRQQLENTLFPALITEWHHIPAPVHVTLITELILLE